MNFDDSKQISKPQEEISEMIGSNSHTHSKFINSVNANKHQPRQVIDKEKGQNRNFHNSQNKNPNRTANYH